MNTEQTLAKQESEQDAKEPEMILTATGMTESTLKAYLRKHGAAPDNCYLCKRKQGDTTLSLKEEGGDRRMATNTVQIKTVARKIGDIVVEFPLCFECYLLLDASRDWIPDDKKNG